MSNVKDDQIDTAIIESCPRCGSEDYIRRHCPGHRLVPECWWWYCDECDYETRPE
jgi:hypothetical protein